MKKKPLLMTMFLTIVGMVSAQNTLVVNDFTLPQSGGNITVTINLDEPNSYNSYGFEIVTPEGFSYPVNSEDLVPCELDGHAGNMAAAHFDDGERVLKVSFIQSSGFENQTLSIRIPLEATTENVGTIHEFTVREIFFITTTFTKVSLNGAVTFDVTVGEPDDGRIHFNETSATLPTYTAGEKGNVSMTRTIKANEWSTLVLPFNLTKANANAIFGNDVQFAMFNGYTIDYGDDEENVTPLGITINFISYTIPARGNLAGGTPVLIKTTKAITDTIKIDNVTLTEGVKEVIKNDSDYSFPGIFKSTLVKTKVPADGLFLSDNKFWYSNGKTTIKAFRGWFELGAVLDKETDFGVKMYVMVDDDPTMVEGISTDVPQGAVYDLSGRKLEKVPQKGIYLINGKKILK
jgi:hypothetical protein